MYVSTRKLEPAAQQRKDIAPDARSPLIDNPFAPEVFATGFAGMSHMNGVITLTAESTRCDHSKPEPVPERVVVARLTLSIPAAQALVANLNDFLERQGHGLTKAIAGGATFQ